MLVTLSPDNSWEFLAAMTKAWEWTQARKRFYCATGGEQAIEEYLEAAKAPDKKQLAAVCDGKMVSLVTVRLITDGCFEIHVTSPRGTRRQQIIDALMAISESLFETMDARTITTSCPTYGNHEHRGSRRLAEICGMKPNGMAWQSGGATWREYEITRAQYYGKSETGHRERIPMVSEAVVGRA